MGDFIMASQEETLSSSPDPLSLCDENFPTPSPIKRRRSSINPRKPLISTSGNTAIQDFFLSSPAPSDGRNTTTKSLKQRNTTSPWRIRLTVQADQIDGERRNSRKDKLSNALEEHTIVTTIPLKGVDDSSPLASEKKRGRPRKSNGTPARRSGTPKPKPRVVRSLTLESSGEEDGGGPLGETPTKKRSKKTSLSNSGHDLETPASRGWQTQYESSEMAAKGKRSKSRNRRKEITPMKLPLNFEQNGGTNSSEYHTSSVGDNATTSNAISQNSPQNVAGYELDSGGHSASETAAASPLEKSTSTKEDEAMWRAMAQRGSHSPQVRDEATQPKLTVDPTEEHHEFDSVLESEGFSMVSISSLPSAGLHSSSPAEQNGGFPRDRKGKEKDCTHASPDVSQPVHGYSDISSIEQDPVPFSFNPSERNWRDETPAFQLKDSLPQPSAPKATEINPGDRPFNQQSEGTPKMVRIVRAGNALHQVLEPCKESSNLQGNRVSLTEFAAGSSEKQSPGLIHLPRTTKAVRKGELEDPFKVFGTGTTRELRAGLRLGEELAKRQIESRSPHETPSSPSETLKEAYKITNDLKTLSQTKETCASGDAFEVPNISYPILPNQQLPSPAQTSRENSEESAIEEADTLNESGLVGERQSRLPQAGTLTSLVDQTMLAREAEWQREREAVSRQIQMANSSQIIVINSDEPSMSSSHLFLESPLRSPEAASETLQISNIAFRPMAPDPRRSGFPEPWALNTESSNTNRLDNSDSALFWRPDEAQTKANKRRLRRKKQDDSLRDESTIPVVGRDQASSDSTSTLLSQLMVNSAHDSSSDSLSSETCSGLPEVKTREVVPSLKDVNSQRHATLERAPSQQIKPSTGLQNPFYATEQVGHQDSLVDPLLLQQNSDQERVKSVPQPEHIGQLPASWLTSLTRPLTGIFSSTASIVQKKSPSYPPATKSDILCSSKHQPLPAFTPCTLAHFHALEPLYYASFLYGSFIFPYNPRSQAARFKGFSVSTSLGWERRVTEADCGVADAFMILLEERSRDVKSPSTVPSGPAVRNQKIDESVVLRMCVQIWVDMVMRGDVALGKGEKAGKRREGDRLWTVKDIRWEDSQRAYYERKKRDWGGLPSWREKGLVWKAPDS